MTTEDIIRKTDYNTWEEFHNGIQTEFFAGNLDRAQELYGMMHAMEKHFFRNWMIARATLTNDKEHITEIENMLLNLASRAVSAKFYPFYGTQQLEDKPDFGTLGNLEQYREEPLTIPVPTGSTEEQARRGLKNIGLGMLNYMAEGVPLSQLHVSLSRGVGKNRLFSDLSQITEAMGEGKVLLVNLESSENIAISIERLKKVQQELYDRPIIVKKPQGNGKTDTTAKKPVMVVGAHIYDKIMGLRPEDFGCSGTPYKIIDENLPIEDNTILHQRTDANPNARQDKSRKQRNPRKR